MRRPSLAPRTRIRKPHLWNRSRDPKLLRRKQERWEEETVARESTYWHEEREPLEELR